MKIIKTLVFVFITIAVGFSQKKIEIKGQVKDGSNSEPIIGANVLVKGTTSGTVTDIDGNFQLSVAENAVLENYLCGSHSSSTNRCCNQ